MGTPIRRLIELLLSWIFPAQGNHRAPIASAAAHLDLPPPSLRRPPDRVWSPDLDTLIFLRPFPDPDPVRPYVLACEAKRRRAEW